MPVNRFDGKKQESPALPDNQGTKEAVPGDTSNGQELPVTVQQLIVAAGLLTGVLQVNAVLLSRDQHIEIVLVGTLKPPGK